MTYFVNLVQRGISANQHPVSGKSGKGYGTAVNSPQHGGVIFKMSLQDYMAAAHDLCGNTIAGQQWVPEFVMEAGAQAQARPKCDRCPKPSVAIWDRYPYCADHAPANATWYDENERPATAPATTPPAAPDVLPVVVEPPMTGGVVDKKAQTDLPREQLAPSFVGSEEETAGAATGPAAPVVMPDVTGPPGVTGPKGPDDFGLAGTSGPITETGPSGPSGAPQPPPAASSEQVEPVAHPPGDKPNSVTVVEAITAGVIKAVVPQLKSLIAEQLGQKPAKPARTKPTTKKAAPPAKPPTEFQKLQTEAKGLGINLYGKGKEQLKREIAAKKEGGAQ